MARIVEFEPDVFGPEKILVVHDPGTGMLGYLVIDNTARGIGKGGVRMAPDLAFNDVLRLSRIMTWKNAAADLPLGCARGDRANAGGVISAYTELVSGTAQIAFESATEKIGRNTREVLEKALKKNISPLEAALEMAQERVVVAMRAKGKWRDVQP